jgi:iron(II)-dependent oxidoreductase
VSPYHLADMAGNLEEWVADYYQADYYSTAPDHDPPGPATVVNHVRRGGSWAGDADQARTSYRTSSHGSSPDFRAGFRCAWDD